MCEAPDGVAQPALAEQGGDTSEDHHDISHV
jgi:hypothetical protein